MDFKANFKNSFLRTPTLGAEQSEYTLLGQVYDEDSNAKQQLLSVLSFADLSCHSPFSYQIHSLDCYMIIYSKHGHGLLSYNNQSYLLKEETLAFIHCKNPFSLSIPKDSWQFQVYFLTGATADLFFTTLSPLSILYDIRDYSSILHYLQIWEKNGLHSTTRNALLDLKIFTDIFSELSQLYLNEQDSAPKAPSYIIYMKKCFDFSYKEDFSLQKFEDELQISKYRLCREFSQYCGTSPLQYLNSRRIDAAKILLRTTDIPVHEIGASVGVENTNHFINLFKKQTSYTPHAYRQQIYAKEC